MEHATAERVEDGIDGLERVHGAGCAARIGVGDQGLSVCKSFWIRSLEWVFVSYRDPVGDLTTLRALQRFYKSSGQIVSRETRLEIMIGHKISASLFQTISKTPVRNPVQHAISILRGGRCSRFMCALSSARF
jgi:hypothetical protein